MKLAIASDIHLEFGPLTLKNEQKADILILAGDLLIAKHLEYVDAYDYYYEFIDNVSSEFPNIIYILGNHEHYHYNFNDTYNDIKFRLAEYPNFHILEKESIIFDNIKFICGTMWSDFNKADPLTMFQIKQIMNDFNLIANDKKLFTPEDALNDHLKFLEFAIEELKNSEGKSVVMITHHSPSFSTVNDKFSHNTIMNGGYCSDLNNLILDNPKIKLWIAGHQHDKYDFMIGPTRLINNARGYYGHELQSYDFSLKYLNI